MTQLPIYSCVVLYHAPLSLGTTVNQHVVDPGFLSVNTSISVHPPCSQLANWHHSPRFARPVHLPPDVAANLQNASVGRRVGFHPLLAMGEREFGLYGAKGRG